MNPIVVKVATEEQFDQLSAMLSKLNRPLLKSLKNYLYSGLYIFVESDWDWSWGSDPKSSRKNYQLIPIETVLNFPQTHPEYFI